MQVSYEMQVREAIEITQARLQFRPYLNLGQDLPAATDCNGIPSSRAKGERTIPTGA